MSQYTLTPAEYANLKNKLAQAVRAKDHDRVIEAAREATAIFEEKGYPDDWTRWQRAREDAELAKHMAAKPKWGRIGGAW